MNARQHRKQHRNFILGHKHEWPTIIGTLLMQGDTCDFRATPWDGVFVHNAIAAGIFVYAGAGTGRYKVTQKGLELMNGHLYKEKQS